MKMDKFIKYVYLFFACCVVGFAVENLWCVLKNGYFESRKSLVYGPFSVAYGIGGVLLTAVLEGYRYASYGKVFLISFVVGTVAEYICSLGQEIVFGSVAWDYSHLPLNINGRVCLLYSAFWGLLGIMWVKFILPFIDKITAFIPLNLSKALVLAFIVFFVFDAGLSAAAAFRMNERQEGTPPSNKIDIFLDEHFDDARMKSIYANSKEVE